MKAVHKQIPINVKVR